MRWLSLFIAIVAVIAFFISLELRDTRWMVGSGVVLVFAAILRDFRRP